MRRKIRRAKTRIKESGLQGSVTVEMTYLMPVILLVIIGCLMATFYFHDKNILAGAAYETAVVGSTKMRERDGVTEEELVSLCRQRIGRKCILLSAQTVSVDITDEEIQVAVKAHKKSFGVSVLKKAAVTKPEQKIRDAGRLKKGAEIVADGLQENLRDRNKESEEDTDGASHYDQGS